MKRHWLFLILIIGVNLVSYADTTTPDNGLYANTIQANALCKEIHSKCENNEIRLSDCVEQMQACREMNAKKQSDTLDKVSKQIDLQNKANAGKSTTPNTQTTEKPAWHFGPP